MRPDSRTGWTLVALLALPLLAGVTLAAIALSESPLESAAQEEPLMGTVELAARTDATSTTVAVVVPQDFPVVSESAGVITNLAIAPGQAIEDGSVAMSVSGRPIVAFVADAPLFRDITTGTKGKDVKAAEAFLSRLGYLKHADRTADSHTAAAIKEFNRDHGHRADGSTLRVAALLWIPAGASAPTAVTARVGEHIGSGSEVFRTVSGESSVSVTAAPVPADRVLTVAGRSATLRAGESTIVDHDDVAMIEAAMSGQGTATGSLTLAQPRTVGTIPAVAVITDANGATCYFPSAAGPPIRVDASQGGFGQVDVDASLVGTPVLLNPRGVIEDQTCG